MLVILPTEVVNFDSWPFLQWIVVLIYLDADQLNSRSPITCGIMTPYLLLMNSLPIGSIIWPVPFIIYSRTIMLGIASCARHNRSSIFIIYVIRQPNYYLVQVWFNSPCLKGRTCNLCCVVCLNFLRCPCSLSLWCLVICVALNDWNMFFRECLIDFYTSFGKRKPDQVIIFRSVSHPSTRVLVGFKTHGFWVDRPNEKH